MLWELFESSRAELWTEKRKGAGFSEVAYGQYTTLPYSLAVLKIQRVKYTGHRSPKQYYTSNLIIVRSRVCFATSLPAVIEDRRAIDRGRRLRRSQYDSHSAQVEANIRVLLIYPIVRDVVSGVCRDMAQPVSGERQSKNGL